MNYRLYKINVNPANAHTSTSSVELPDDEVSDTTGDDSSSAVGSITHPSSLKKFISLNSPLQGGEVFSPLLLLFEQIKYTLILSSPLFTPLLAFNNKSLSALNPYTNNMNDRLYKINCKPLLGGEVFYGVAICFQNPNYFKEYIT